MGNVIGREVVECGRNRKSRERDAKSRGSGSNRPAWVMELGNQGRRVQRFIKDSADTSIKSAACAGVETIKGAVLGC